MAKYCRHSDYLSAPGTGGKLWIWRSLLQVRDVIEAGLCWQIRSGEHLNIWCTPWVRGVAHFKPKLRMGALVDRHTNCVRDLIREDSHTWNQALIWNLFETQSAAAILDIRLLATPGIDVPLWILDPKGTLTVKTAYSYIVQSRGAPIGWLSPAEWKILWKLKIQHRLKLMLWKVLAHALPLRGKIGRWVDDGRETRWLCPMCGNAEESN